MNNITLPICLILASSIPTAALAADNYRCTNGDLVRRVEIVYEPGRAVPCEVQYYKDTEAPGEPQVLWRAQNEAGYCESKTTTFIQELASQGWSCNAGDSAEIVVVDEVLMDDEGNVIEEDVIVEELIETDDTEALTPAQDNN